MGAAAQPVTFDDLEQVVLWFWPCHHQQVAPRLQTPCGQQRRIRPARLNRVGPIGDEAARRAAWIGAAKTPGDRVRVSDQACGRSGGDPFHGAQIGARQPSPFAARPLQPVDVDPDRNAAHARPPARPRSTIAQHIDQVVAPPRIQQTGTVVGQHRGRAPVWPAPCAHAHTQVRGVGARRAIGFGIHRDPVPALDQANGQALGERFESAVAGRDTPRAQNGHAQRRPLRAGRARSRTVQHSASGSRRPARSLSDSSGSEMPCAASGQSMPMAGSSQRMERSWAGL